MEKLDLQIPFPGGTLAVSKNPEFESNDARGQETLANYFLMA